MGHVESIQLLSQPQGYVQRQYHAIIFVKWRTFGELMETVITLSCSPQISRSIEKGRCMDKKASLSALAALGQETRLDIFRLLVRAGAEGIPACSSQPPSAPASRPAGLHRRRNGRCGARDGARRVAARRSETHASGLILTFAFRRYNPIRQMSESKDHWQGYDSSGTLNSTFACSA